MKTQAVQQEERSSQRLFPLKRQRKRQKTAAWGQCALMLGLLVAGAGAALAQNAVSIKFVGTGPSLAPGDSAGVVPKANWNNATNNNGSLASLLDSTGTATAASVTWNAPGTYGFGASGANPGDVKLMSGYLDEFNGGDTAVVTVSGLATPANGYDVYVYADGDGTNGRQGNYTIGSSTQTIIDNANFSGTFTLGPNGNYLVFHNVQGPSLTLTATATAGSPPRAPVNGIQIVPAQSMAPPPPAAPTKLTATSGVGFINLNWTASANAASYNIKRGIASGAYTNLAGTANTSFQDSSATPNITYYYVVTAVNSTAESGPSNEASATASAPPATITGIIATATSAQNANRSPDFVVDAAGLDRTGNGTALAHGTSPDGAMWNSGYPGGSADIHPTIFFDLGRVYTLSSFRVWNYNENTGTDATGRGFKNVLVSTSVTGAKSADGTFYADTANVAGPNSDGTFDFLKAPGTSDYTGDVYTFPAPVTTRYISLTANSNYQGNDVAGLSEVRFSGNPTGPALVQITGITATASSAQRSPTFTVNNSGLSESFPGSGIFYHTANPYADGGSMWNASYPGGSADINATLFFDLGAVYTIGSFHVWNYNEDYGGYRYRSIRDALFSTSATGTLSPDGSIYTDAAAVPGYEQTQFGVDGSGNPVFVSTFPFAKAPGYDQYEGEYYAFPTPVTTRYLSLQCVNRFGADLPGLSEIQFFKGAATSGTGATVTGTIALEGVTDLFGGISKYAPLGTFRVDFRTPGTMTVVKTANVSLTPVAAGNPNGTFSVSGVPAGTYDVLIKGAKNLAVLSPGVVVSATSGVIPAVSLPAGDANNDNSVDSTDFGLLIGEFNLSGAIAGSGYDPAEDFNFDGSVDSTDFGLLIGEFNNMGAK